MAFTSSGSTSAGHASSGPTSPLQPESGRQENGQTRNRRTYLSNSRLMSGFELLLGAAIVIGHNVFHVIWNEVPVLFVIGLISIRLRNGGLSAIGFARPSSWLRIVLIALGAAVLRIALSAVVIEPLTAKFWPPEKAPAEIDEIAGNIWVALQWLAIVWTFAAFGEEIVYRGYLLLRAADLGGRSNASYWVAVVIVSVLFGYGHYYKGPAGIIDSGVSGLILGSAFMLTGRNLWTSVLAHGFIDTIGLLAVYFGLDS